MSRHGEFRLGWIGLLLAAFAGCGLGDDPPALVVATIWPPSVRARAAALYHEAAGSRPIQWVTLGADALPGVAERRGGVDLIAGVAARDLLPLLDSGQLVPIEPNDSIPWRVVDRPPEPTDHREAGPSPTPPLADPIKGRDQADEARRVLALEGWERGFATLARRRGTAADGARPSIPPPRLEVLARLRISRHLDQAERFTTALQAAGWLRPAVSEAEGLARADDLMADLLDSAFVEALPERRDALEALERFGHPPTGEKALGQLPPWPPASVARLLADPTHESLVEALLTQITPDFAARATLRASWTGPRKVVDPGLLLELATANDGRLVREPRVRAWLRGEWIASMQQHYRRVARLARGYRPL